MDKTATWIHLVQPDGQAVPHLTFDPFSKQWIYVLLRGAYGILRSYGGWTDDRLVFTGLMTTLGINCDWRLTMLRTRDDQFSLINQEGDPDGGWIYIDEWRLQRQV